MQNKIVRFPLTTSRRGVQRITGYQPTTGAETLIAIWLSGWALLTAAACFREISEAPLSTVQPPEQAKAQTYLVVNREGNSNSPVKSTCPRESCNFSYTPGVLRLN
jgi:hypothetical protein